MEKHWIYDLFIQILNMSITAGIIICIVLGIRLLLRRAPKFFRYLLWSVVLFRLLCPVAIPSPFSLLRLWTAPAAETSNPAFIAAQPIKDTPVLSAEQNGDSFPAAPVLQEKAASAETMPATAVSREHPAFLYGCALWLTGIFAMFLYGIVSTLRLRRRLACSILIKDNIYLSDGIDTPFTMGIIAPKIYLPQGLSDRETEFIVLHEKTHIRRGDPIIKLLSFFALTIHWFNPLVWIAFFTAEKDMEMSCDETVMKKIHEDIRADYSRSLLCLSSGKRILNGTPLAFGEGNTKSRVKNIMHYKKPAVLMVCAAVLLVTGCLLGFGTNPGNESEPKTLTSETETAQPETTQTETATEEEPFNQAAIEEELLEQTAEHWTEAFCSRDGEEIARMSSEQTKESLKNAGLLDETGETYTFGVSSPWPMDDADCHILCKPDNTVEIMYYARTSEPHAYVWKETLTFTQQADKSILATEERLDYYDEIRSLQEFTDAYPNGISYTPLDYIEEDTAKNLYDKALLSGSQIYQNLSSPETAAIYLLNLDENTVTASTIKEQDDGNVLVNLHFTDGSFTVKMIHLFAKDDLNGIWIPQDFEEEESSENVPVYTYSPKQEILLGQYGTGFDDEFYDLYTEETVYSVTADVTHDGILDRLDVIAADNNESPHTDAVKRLDGIGLGYVKVYPGTKDGGFEENPCFITPQLSSAHVGNGQICLVKKDGMDYLLTSNMYEIMGMAGYYYAVFYLNPEDHSAICADEQNVGFSVSEGETDTDLPRKERIPDFIEHLEQWTDDSILFISCDVFSDPSVYLSKEDKIYTASDYYDSVWER